MPIAFVARESTTRRTSDDQSVSADPVPVFAPTHLQEQAILKPALVSEVVVLAQRVVKIAHARREVPRRELVHLFRPNEFSVFISKRGSGG
jgi:hypothetical protein